MEKYDKPAWRSAVMFGGLFLGATIGLLFGLTPLDNETNLNIIVFILLLSITMLGISNLV
jgi:uncharacterized membrane protein AbrB (regulator of aidB expression)